MSKSSKELTHIGRVRYRGDGYQKDKWSKTRLRETPTRWYSESGLMWPKGEGVESIILSLGARAELDRDSIRPMTAAERLAPLEERVAQTRFRVEKVRGDLQVAAREAAEAMEALWAARERLGLDQTKASQ